MARLPRLYLPGCAHHIIQRGNNHVACFHKAGDYAFYLDKLYQAQDKYRVAVHAFVLMTNHVHLLATPSNATGVSRMMQAIGRSYVGHFNHAYGRTGTLWEGRYKSTLVDTDDYFLTVSRYIEMNPVRANMVEHVADYPWSSYQANALGKDIKLLTPHEIYSSLAVTKDLRLKNYRTLFHSQIPTGTLQEIRKATNKSWALGDKEFQARIEKLTGRVASPRLRGGDRKSKKQLSK